MDFARKQLEKYGWSDGKGLGKNGNGISEALKPKLKRSVTGIGHDAAADFTEHWWTQLYNKAASNVEVEEKNGKTKKIKTKDTEEFEITNSMWKIKKKKKKCTDPEEQYTDFFVKKAILTNDGHKIELARSESDDEKEEEKDVFKMTDEQLFAACEGRTAHKGARHGLKATGKLARIAQQEQMLLIQPQYNSYSHAKKLKDENNKLSVSDLQVVEDMSLNSDGDITSMKKKKNKKKRCTSQSNINENNLEPNETEPLPKTNKRKDKNVATENNDVTRKKSKLVTEEIDLNIENETRNVENLDGKKKKKKSKCNEKDSIKKESNIVHKDEEMEMVSVKKTKKKKLKKLD